VPFWALVKIVFIKTNLINYTLNVRATLLVAVPHEDCNEN